MSVDPYRKLATGSVRCQTCEGRLAADRKAYFRFDADGNRSWCCGAAACLNVFFGPSKTEEVYELDEEYVLVLDAVSRKVRERLPR